MGQVSHYWNLVNFSRALDFSLPIMPWSLPREGRSDMFSITIGFLESISTGVKLSSDTPSGKYKTEIFSVSLFLFPLSDFKRCWIVWIDFFFSLYHSFIIFEGYDRYFKPLHRKESCSIFISSSCYGRFVIPLSLSLPWIITNQAS